MDNHQHNPIPETCVVKFLTRVSIVASDTASNGLANPLLRAKRMQIMMASGSKTRHLLGLANDKVKPF